MNGRLTTPVRADIGAAACWYAILLGLSRAEKSFTLRNETHYARPKLRFLRKRHFRFTTKADSRGLMLVWSLRVNSDLACHQQVRPCPRCIASTIKDRLLWVNGAARDVIEDPKLESWIVRYELSDFEWAAIKPFLPNKSRGVRRVNDRSVLNGIFWVLRSSAPWRDLPVCYGPRTTCYNRFVRWRKAGE